MSEWIKCSDILPEKGRSVLIFSKNRIFHGWWDDVSSTMDWYDIQNCWIIEDVSHWMPFPRCPDE